jgi:hypothetical protein
MVHYLEEVVVKDHNLFHQILVDVSMPHVLKNDARLFLIGQEQVRVYHARKPESMRVNQRVVCIKSRFIWVLFNDMTIRAYLNADLHTILV